MNNQLITGLNTWASTTANGAVTNESSLNKCLDFFFLSGASRQMEEEEIVALFSSALNTDKNTAMKILFRVRDVRNWAGERRIFRVLLQYLASNHEDILKKVIEYVPEYGRFDDLFYSELILNHTMKYLVKQIEDIHNLPLLAKWLPREKSSKGNIAKLIIEELGISPKEYRHMLAENSITVENQLCDNEWDNIEYKKVPSKAFNIYSSAFMRHDEDRFTKFLADVEEWTEKVNAWAIFPVDLYKSFKNNDKPMDAINAQWAALPDYMDKENIIAVCDTSGSMTMCCEDTQPLDVAVSLWVYISERSKWIFKDHFITFEGKPKLQSLSWKPTDRFQQLRGTDSDCSTNLMWVFKLLLKVAERDNISPEDMPTKLIIISDMEFNQSTWMYWQREESNFTAINALYEASKYTRPELVFRNVNWRQGNVPCQVNDNRTALVSGYSPSILTSVLGWKDLTPIGVLMTTLERYNFIDNLKL